MNLLNVLMRLVELERRVLALSSDMHCEMVHSIVVWFSTVNTTSINQIDMQEYNVQLNYNLQDLLRV